MSERGTIRDLYMTVEVIANSICGPEIALALMLSMFNEDVKQGDNGLQGAAAFMAGGHKWRN